LVFTEQALCLRTIQMMSPANSGSARVIPATLLVSNRSFGRRKKPGELLCNSGVPID
jgi:hypothetical protein